MIGIVTVADDGAQGELEIVHRTITGPLPPVCWNIAFGVELFGRNIPVPPLSMLQLPVPISGVLPPNPTVVLPAQMVCGPPAVAMVGG